MADAGNSVSKFDKYLRAGAYHWGKISGHGPRTLHARLTERYGWFVREASRRSPRRIVDIGCGDGALTHLLASETDAETVGIEPDPEGAALGQARLAEVGSHASIRQAQAGKLPLPDGWASIVVLCEVIEHVERPSDLLSEAARVCGERGVVLLSTPQSGKVLADPLHIREFEANELQRLCAQHFREVAVLVAEPRWLLRIYASRIGRVATNCLALCGLNPFAIRRGPSRTRRSWAQLYAIAAGPRR